jgi:hypothetical protein
MDQAAMGEDAHNSALVFLREHLEPRPIASIMNSRILFGVMGLLFVLGMSSLARGQQEQAKRRPVRQPARAVVDTFPLEPAPAPAPSTLDKALVRTSEVTKTRKNPSRSDVPGATDQIPGASGGPAAPEVERSQTILDLPADLNSLRIETAEQLKQSNSPSAGPATSGPLSEPLDHPLSPESKSTAGKVARTPSTTTPEADAGPGSTTRKPTMPAGSRAGNQALRAVLLERQSLLDEHDQVAKELQELTNPNLSPEKQTATARAELERLQTQLAQLPQSLVPPVFQGSATEFTKAALGEMKDAIGTAQNDLNEWQAKFEGVRAELARAGSKQNALRTERDRLFQQLATFTAPSQERQAVANSSKTPQARLLAQERLTNTKLAARVGALRLKIAETKLARESSLADLRELHQHVLEAHVQVSRKLLDQMQRRYREVAELQQRALERAAATQENVARQSDDPLEQYRARRRAEILDLEARVIKNEQALAAGTHPALEEQRALADRAEADFAQIKQLLDDGDVSRLDALRLNNDFRRIGPERDRLLRNELTTIETQLQYYENMLTSVELELIEDSLADQVEHDAVLERLAPQRHGQARSDFMELERSYWVVLARQKVALTKLVARAAETLEQVTRRLRVLEEEYGFIRTHIFWVRDQEPIGLATVQQAGHELKRLVKGMLKLAEESSDRESWAHSSSEFLTAAVAAVILPLGLFRLRRLLRRRITRALPPSHLHGNQVQPIRVEMSQAIR